MDFRRLVPENWGRRYKWEVQVIVTSGDGGTSSSALLATVFDNATGVGRRVGEIIHEAELFSRMRAHYGFSVRFCNPESSHEKGNVEAKIGYTCRNLFVSVPAFDDIEDYNRTLLSLHTSKAQKSHYKKLLPSKDLLKEDTRALLPLPRISPSIELAMITRTLKDGQQRRQLHATLRTMHFRTNMALESLSGRLWKAYSALEHPSTTRRSLPLGS